MSSHGTMMSMGVVLFGLMVTTSEGAPIPNFNVLIIDKIRNKEINPNMMEEIKTEMGGNKAVDQIRGIARNQTEKVLKAPGNKNASNVQIHEDVIVAMKNKVHKIIVEKEKLVTSETADEIFTYFIESFGKDINDEIEKVIEENRDQVYETNEIIDQNKTTRFNVNKEINQNITEEIQIEMGETTSMENYKYPGPLYETTEIRDDNKTTATTTTTETPTTTTKSSGSKESVSCAICIIFLQFIICKA